MSEYFTRECIIVNGVLMNIGPWDYGIIKVFVEFDEEGNPVYEERVTNPLPEGAVTETRELEYGPDGGIYERGKVPINFEDDVRRTFVDLFTGLVQSNSLTIDKVPEYNDYRNKVQAKLSEFDA